MYVGSCKKKENPVSINTTHVIWCMVSLNVEWSYFVVVWNMCMSTC